MFKLLFNSQYKWFEKIIKQIEKKSKRLKGKLFSDTCYSFENGV